MAVALGAKIPYEVVIEDFEDANLWSPVTSTGWWHLDEDKVYTYTINQKKAYKGKYSMKLDYEKSAPFQLVGAYFDSINPKCNFSDYDVLRIRVFGSVKLLLKMEDRRGEQANVGIKTALNADQWNDLEFNFSKLKLDQSNIKNLFLFVAPNDAQAKGTLYIDHITLSKKNLDNVSSQIHLSEEGKEKVGNLMEGIPIVSAVDLACDVQGNLFIVQKMGSFIFKYDQNGHYVQEIGRLGQSLGEFNEPLAISFNPEKTAFYVADSVNKRLQKLSTEGVVDETFAQKGLLTWRGDGKPFGELKDIAVDDEGYVYVLDISDNTIWKYRSDGKSGQLFWKKQGKASFFLEPVRLKIHQGYMYVMDEAASSIDKFDLDGKYVSSAKCIDEKGAFFISSDCAFDPISGSCLVISSKAKGIYVFDKNWKYLGVSHLDRLGQLKFIDVIIKNNESLVFVGDHSHRKVMVLKIQEVQDGIQ